MKKGAFPAEYGGRIGSVIDVHNKDGNRNEFHGRVSLGLLASRVLLEGPWSKGSWMVALRRSTLEPVLAVLRNQDINGIPDSFYFYDLNANPIVSPYTGEIVELDSTKTRMIAADAEDAQTTKAKAQAEELEDEVLDDDDVDVDLDDDLLDDDDDNDNVSLDELTDVAAEGDEE